MLILEQCFAELTVEHEELVLIRKGLPVSDESTLEMYGVDTGNLKKSQTEVIICDLITW